jgi:hypothetical protein
VPISFSNESCYDGADPRIVSWPVCHYRNDVSRIAKGVRCAAWVAGSTNVSSGGKLLELEVFSR